MPLEQLRWTVWIRSIDNLKTSGKSCVVKWKAGKGNTKGKYGREGESEPVSSNNSSRCMLHTTIQFTGKKKPARRLAMPTKKKEVVFTITEGIGRKKALGSATLTLPNEIDRGSELRLPCKMTNENQQTYGQLELRIDYDCRPADPNYSSPPSVLNSPPSPLPDDTQKLQQQLMEARDNKDRLEHDFGKRHSQLSEQIDTLRAEVDWREEQLHMKERQIEELEMQIQTEQTRTADSKAEKEEGETRWNDLLGSLQAIATKTTLRDCNTQNAFALVNAIEQVAISKHCQNCGGPIMLPGICADCPKLRAQIAQLSQLHQNNQMQLDLQQANEEIGRLQDEITRLKIENESLKTTQQSPTSPPPQTDYSPLPPNFHTPTTSCTTERTSPSPAYGAHVTPRQSQVPAAFRGLLGGDDTLASPSLQPDTEPRSVECNSVQRQLEQTRSTLVEVENTLRRADARLSNDLGFGFSDSVSYNADDVDARQRVCKIDGLIEQYDAEIQELAAEREQLIQYHPAFQN
eukprot:TRINITY_DN66995_c13_g1_i1.p1 TRINITY_DN66995_c13_g1~~TRINITY_DN66995_c13_g1_i1.p1  ORF type:complete len:518 (-),score=27.40 TRINITY_DN66995_c13_g1_i1:1013-2566(-)